MKTVFDRSFSKSLDKINSRQLLEKIENIIILIESANSLNIVPHLKKMEGFKTFYRIRIGDYRLGIELEPDNTVRFIIVAHRKDIYKIFP